MFRSGFGLVLFIFLLGPISSFAGELAVLARPGPWPVADRLIAYRGKVWFSTAVKGVDHNSADIWSFDPAAQDLRFKRYLFSQDVGHPVVHKGLLYWPHEDMRIGLGAGIVSVTDGSEWRDLIVPVGDHMMHTHATTEWKGKLVAAMAGWNSALAASEDAGKSWQLLVNDPPKSGSFHRFNDIASLENRLFVRHWQTTGLSLGEYRDGTVVPVEGWPNNRYFSGFTPFAGALYSLVDDDTDKAELWRIDAKGPRRVDINSVDLDMRQLLSDGERLWVVTRTHGGGQLWSSTDGADFVVGEEFKGGVSHSAVAIAPGAIYVAGEGADGRSILWGPRTASIDPPPAPPDLPEQRQKPDPAFDAPAEGDLLNQILGATQNYQSHGRPLRAALQSVLAKRPPPGFFTSLLSAQVPDQDIEIFGGRSTVRARNMATWQILAAMAQNGEKTIPVRFLTVPWHRPSNRPQKWFDSLLVALYAIQLTGQKDRATVEALVDRLDFQDDPDWLQSQITGTLSAITGKPFAYDRAAWKKWWLSAKSGWPRKAS